MAGSSNPEITLPQTTPPRWLLAELTYACPLQCPYCSNPLDYTRYKNELTTDDWKRVLSEARSMGAVQLGLSGGEPLVRQDLTEIVNHARELGYYTNLITSGHGLNEDRIIELKDAGLDHIQISFQASSADLNDYIAGTNAFQQKKDMARLVKKHGYPMVLCVVIHRQNIHQMRDILELAIELEADYVEIANTQYYGWAHRNRDQLLPTRQQFIEAEAIAQQYKQKLEDTMKIYYVVPDYYEDRPKACMNGWGTTFLTIAPDGTALPCHAAAQLPDLKLPNVRDLKVREIWEQSDAFNWFRGDDWMKQPCRECPEKTKDFGGCRCQAYLLTGDMYAADPVCSKSPDHAIMTKITDATEQTNHLSKAQPLIFRNSKNATKPNKQDSI